MPTASSEEATPSSCPIAAAPGLVMNATFTPPTAGAAAPGEVVVPLEASSEKAPSECKPPSPSTRSPSARSPSALSSTSPPAHGRVEGGGGSSSPSSPAAVPSPSSPPLEPVGAIASAASSAELSNAASAQSAAAARAPPAIDGGADGATDGGREVCAEVGTEVREGGADGLVAVLVAVGAHAATSGLAPPAASPIWLIAAPPSSDGADRATEAVGSEAVVTRAPPTIHPPSAALIERLDSRALDSRCRLAHAAPPAIGAADASSWSERCVEVPVPVRGPRRPSLIPPPMAIAELRAERGTGSARWAAPPKEPAALPCPIGRRA